MRRLDFLIKSANTNTNSVFKTYLAIQLDGICNGLQYLALLSYPMKLKYLKL